MKLVGSLIASSALGLSVLVAVPPTASAAPPYPGTVATQCSYAVPGSVRKNRRLNVAYRVRANGNARPSGLVTFRVWKVTRAGNLIFNRALSNGYTGPNIRFKSLGKFKKRGRYVTQMSFRPNRGSVYKSCATGLRGFRVRR